MIFTIIGIIAAVVAVEEALSIVKSAIRRDWRGMRISILCMLSLFVTSVVLILG